MPLSHISLTLPDHFPTIFSLSQTHDKKQHRLLRDGVTSSFSLDNMFEKRDLHNAALSDGMLKPTGTPISRLATIPEESGLRIPLRNMNSRGNITHAAHEDGGPNESITHKKRFHGSIRKNKRDLKKRSILGACMLDKVK
jgi:hypothetical protein